MTAGCRGLLDFFQTYTSHQCEVINVRCMYSDCRTDEEPLHAEFCPRTIAGAALAACRERTTWFVALALASPSALARRGLQRASTWL